MDTRRIPPETIERQHRASHPALTAWVSANAGSGKTHVLTQRVVRLLLQGVPPARILCLTFTKAAAANMAMRVFRDLSQWSTADDDTLRRRILGTGHPASDIDLPFARRLFARTVETPGGLKIQTIHAFCEKLLHLFPFEADVGAQFRVIEDEEQAELIGSARLLALAEAGADPESPLGQALQLLSAETSAEGFEELVSEALKHREALATMRAADLQHALGIAPGDTIARLEEELIAGGIAPSQWSDLAALFAQGGSTDKTAAACLTQALAQTGAERIASYLSVFFTGKDEPRARLATAAIARLAPDLPARLVAEQDRLVALRDRLSAARCVERSMALACLLKRVAANYARLKDARGALDFDDLIRRTRDLVARAGAPWVLFKLDGGIDHILVDEAQDTSEPQWQILLAMAEEFFAGHGRRPQRRTFFAVGDEKQSIYSFQGANPRLFDRTRRDVQTRIPDPENTFAFVELKTSFRSTPGILEAVDTVFAPAANRRGLSADDVQTVHEALKSGVPSLVELWKPVQPDAEEEVRDWRLPLDMRNEDDPPVKVASRIARMVADWLKPGNAERVQDDDTGAPRRIRAGDILILVRRRGPFFEAVIRALKEQLVPVAGADRLELTQHIAIMDLMAAGRAALLPQDDLTIACVLKSPLIGLDDDDLLALAPRRDGSLLQALRRSDDPAHRAAHDTLLRWQRDARRLTPFRFYAQLLGAGQGRCRLLARLGPEAGDAVDEFLKLALQHDRTEAPSLHAFLTRLEASDLSVKRDMEAASDAVRVMTVHASKGLEAKIVLLPDTCGAPSGRHDPRLFSVGEQLVAWSPRAREDCAAVASARLAVRESAADEYRRLLYVALTRAQERLYVMGFHGKAARPSACWYDMIEGTLAPLMDEVPAAWDPADSVLRLRRDRFETTDLEAVAPRVEEAADLPEWLFAPAAPEATVRPVLRPSRLEEDEAARPGRDQLAARARGLLVHAVLQHLAAVAPARRDEAGPRFLAVRHPGLEPAAQEAILAEAGAVLQQPELRVLFESGSRAEVAVAGRFAPTGEAISGQVDRVAVDATQVTIADFKTGAPPGGPAPAAYVAQLALYAHVFEGLYPGRTIRTLLVYTQGPRVIEVSAQARHLALAKLGGTPVA